MPRGQPGTMPKMTTAVNEVKPHGEIPEGHHKDKGSGHEDRGEELLYSSKDNN